MAKRNPVGIFDKNGHGYCIECGQDVPPEDFDSFDYEAVDCEICGKSFLHIRFKDNDTKDHYEFIK